MKAPDVYWCMSRAFLTCDCLDLSTGDFFTRYLIRCLSPFSSSERSLTRASVGEASYGQPHHGLFLPWPKHVSKGCESLLNFLGNQRKNTKVSNCTIKLEIHTHTLYFIYFQPWATLMQALRLMTFIYLNAPLRVLYLKTDVNLRNELYPDLRNFNLP